LSSQLKPRPTDYMIKCMAELINDGDVVYHGLASQIPVLSMILAREALGKDFIWLSVTEAYMPLSETVKFYPSSGDPFSEKFGVGIVPTYDVFDLAAQGRVDLMFFGAAQIDENGNTNLSVIGRYDRPKVRLPGGAATAYLFPLVKRIVVWARHDRRTLVRRVDFVTGQGWLRIKKGLKLLLCTNKGLIEYTDKGPILKALFEHEDIKDVIGNANMKINISNKLYYLKAPNEMEMKIIHRHDPLGLRYRLGYG